MQSKTMHCWLIACVCVTVGVLALCLASRVQTAHAQFIQIDVQPGVECQ
jgi:hypothetical protein